MSDEPEANRVARLIDHGRGYSVDDIHDLCEWLRGWTKAIEDGEEGKPRALILVVQREDGSVFKVSQAMPGVRMDLLATVGLLHAAAHYVLEGLAKPRS